MRTEPRTPTGPSRSTRKLPRLWLFFLLLTVRPGLCQVDQSDHMFPAAPAAKAFIDFDRHGFLINGKRTFIVSGSIHYARIPRELWRDRLLRLKRAGFNTVETYVFWNFHEPYDNQFNFSGDHDLNAFLQLVKQIGMYATVRVGPYDCAEWVSGGYPLFLRFQPGLRVRDDNPQFEADVGQFFDKLIPIVAANQINRGGPVILVQLENEHPLAGGTKEPNPYFKFLHAKAVSLGTEVPYFFSGVHHGEDPVGAELSLDDPSRPNPWFTTELWSQNGPVDGSSVAHSIWKMIARGAGGYNVYMGEGGSNFGYSNNDEDASTYDFVPGMIVAARYPIGEGGDLRSVYFKMKLAGWFAQSFQDILEDSTDANAAYKDISQDPSVLITARQSPAGTIIFLENAGASPVETRLKVGGRSLPMSSPLTLAPLEIMPVVHDFTLVPGVMLRWAPCHILGVAHQDDQVSLAIYGAPGAAAELSFWTEQDAKITTGASAFSRTPAGIDLQTHFPKDHVDEYRFVTGGRPVRVLAMSTAVANRTWFVSVAGQTVVVTGPDYVNDVSLQDGRLRMTTEHFWSGGETGGPAIPPTVYTSAPAALHLHEQPIPGARIIRIAPSAWQRLDGSKAASPKYDDHAWLAREDPQQMGADGDLTCDAWYRTVIEVPVAGNYVLDVRGGAGDRASAFVDGTPAGGGSIRGGALQLHLPAGKHTLAIFTAHDGRMKWVGYIGEIATEDAKGLNGEALLLKGSATRLSDWRMILLKPPVRSTPQSPPAKDSPDWKDFPTWRYAFAPAGTFAWFQTTLFIAPAEHYRLRFDTGNDDATLFVEGREVMHHEGSKPLFDVDLDGLVKANTSVTLSLLMQNNLVSGGIWIYNPAIFTSYDGDAIPVTGWRMRGGPGDPFAESGWSPLGAMARFQGPQFFRATFTVEAPTEVGHHPVWRVVTAGLGHGSVWVNGHNLGRYPQMLPWGAYIPECWLKPGTNTLIVYDEDGKSPEKVSVQADNATSRDVAEAVVE